MDARQLGERLIRDTTASLEALVDAHLPELAVPRVFAGHPVGPDVRADLAYTLGWLHEGGVGEIAGIPMLEAVSRSLRGIDGAATHTFFSYRVAETLGRFGPLAGNPATVDWSEAELHEVERATDSTDWIELLDGVLPANYAAVLARCERARAALGLRTDEDTTRDLLERVRALLERNPEGYLDDSEAGTGVGAGGTGGGSGGRYDIYTADIYLFTEPLAQELGACWEHGARRALALVDRVQTRDGTAVPWGRSTGALGVCLTIELAALAIDRGLCEDPERWLGAGANAATRVGTWFRDGLVTAHQRRSPYAYRGPARRLQMSLDCLGKLAYAGAVLRGTAWPDAGAAAVPVDELLCDRDELVVFDGDRHAGVWTYRSRDLAFVLPLVGPTRSDYLPAPRNPSLFEVPVDAPLATGVPFVVSGDARHVGGGLPVSWSKAEGRLRLRYDGFPEIDTAASQGRRLAGEREVEVRVEGRTLHVHERLRLEREPDAVSVQVTETAGRPLRVRFHASVPHRSDVIDVDGLAEYRSFWAELPRVHQVDLEPARELAVSWEVTPLLRVATNAIDHHYHRSLYDPLADRVHEISMPSPMLDRPDRASQRLRDADLFHLHWPEWFVPPEADAARSFCDLLDGAEVRLVWTQHNLEPHTKDERHHAVYQVFAERADLVIHHSEWGLRAVTERYRFGSGTHVVVPHGHFGHLGYPAGATDRAHAEEELGLEPCALRIGIVGAPRREKRTQAFMEAFARTRREDLQLLVLSLGEDEEPPEDPRVTALPYEFVERSTYERRLAAIDVVALPFDPAGAMLTTGVVGDVVGRGLPAIISDWGFLTEMLGEAGLVYRSDDELVALLEGLEPGDLAATAKASAARRDDYDWEALAERTLQAFEELGTRKL